MCKKKSTAILSASCPACKTRFPPQEEEEEEEEEEKEKEEEEEE